MGLYVYGVVPTGPLDEFPEGIGGSPVELIGSGPLSALASRVPADGLRVRRADLRRHLSVLETAFRTTTVVPCRFGTVVEDEQVLRADLLDARRTELAAALDRLAGKSQLVVKATYDQDAVLREVVVRDPRIARLRAGVRRLGDAGHFARLQLGEAVAHAVSARRAHDAARVIEHVRRACDEVVTEDPSDELTIVKASCLVRNPERLHRVLEELAKADHGVIRYDAIGPLPPTAFAGADAGLGG